MVRFASPTGPHHRRLRPDEVDAAPRTIKTVLRRKCPGAKTLKTVRDVWSQDLSDQGLRSSLNDSRQVLRAARSQLRSVPSSDEIASIRENRKVRTVGPWADLSRALKEKEKPPEEGARKLTRLYFHPRVPKQVCHKIALTPSLQHI